MGGRSRVSQAGQAPACRRGFQHLAGVDGNRELIARGGIPVSSFNELRQTLRVVKTTVPTFAAQQKRLNLRQLHAGGGRRRPDNGHWVALFGGSEFTARNPVSQVMQGMLAELDGKGLEAETAKLKDFYASVERRVQGVDNSEARQRVMAELYDRFFQTAFPRDAERLGIVYTPVEIVDFIIRSVAELLRREFGAYLGDEGVHILDPFTGTGTFIVRLLQSGLISPDDLPRARPGDHGREPRGDRARGDGAHPGAAAPAPLRRGPSSGRPSSGWAEPCASGEPQRYEITHVSAPIRQRDQVIAVGEPVLHRYERLEHIGLISRRTDQARRKRHHDHPLAASASVHASP